VSINRLKLGALLCVVAAAIAVVASTAGATSQGAPGVTGDSITIGGTFPLSGPASLYATIQGAEKAYFGYVNAHGGVHGRMINDIIRDDQYDPSQTPALVKQLVEQDHVFAIVGSLGTAPALSTWNYLNGHGVPQVLLATGDSYWGQCSPSGQFTPVPGVCKTAKRMTMGWQPDYPSEARVYAKYILAHKPNAQIGILRQDDAYGANYTNAFVKALNGNGFGGSFVDTEQYDVTDSSGQIQAHVAALKAHGADTVAIFATPSASITAMATMGALSWNPLTFLNNVSANRIFLLSAESHGATPDGVVSTSYIKSQTVTPNDNAMQLGHDIIYATGSPSLKHQWDIGDNNLVYGLAVAWTFVDALKHAGVTPTRASFMSAMRNLHESGNNANPFVFPGMNVVTSNTRTFPMEQLILQKWDATAHDWNTVGGVINSGK
jgi:branched-chain amino acid transport system substrate-binding protein